MPTSVSPAKVIEAVRQLRGEAHPKVQVPGCTLALAHGTGGLLGTRHDDRLEFKKGGAALVDVSGRLAGGGSLVFYLPPKVLRRL